MRAVPTLLRIYFCSSPLTAWLFGLGLVCAAAGMAGFVLLPPAQSMNVAPGEPIPWLEIVMQMLPLWGLVFLLAASALLPAIVEKMLRSRTIRVLPLGGTCLLISTVAVAALLALLTATAAMLAFYPLVFSAFPDTPGSALPIYRLLFEVELFRVMFLRTLPMAFVDIGLIYLAIWLVGKTSGLWRLVGTLWVIVCILIPLRYLGGAPSFSFLEWIGVGAWLTFAAAALAGDRLMAVLQGRDSDRFARLRARLTYSAGQEVTLMLGTARPWMIAIGQLVPIALMTWFIPADSRRYWLVILVVFSALAGAITSQAAGRCRRLWLRFDWTRPQIFRHAERTYWRYNASLLAVLLVTFLGLGLYESLAAEIIVFGLALLVLGCAVCTYLGLMVTRELGWLETVACISTMLVLTLAGMAAISNRMTLAVALGALTIVLAFVYRLVAKVRWDELDWMRSGRLTTV